jgi:hypothetical protein
VLKDFTAPAHPPALRAADHAIVPSLPHGQVHYVDRRRGAGAPTQPLQRALQGTVAQSLIKLHPWSSRLCGESLIGSSGPE